MRRHRIVWRVYWLGVAFGIALLATLLTGGSLVRLLGLPIQSLWLLIVGLGIQITLWLIDVPADRVDDLGFGLLMVSYALILAFCFVNIRVRGMAIVAVGFAMNAVVTGLNEGMPTREEEVETRSGRTVDRPIERTATERPESDDDLLPFFGQVIPLPENPVDEALAPGDLVITAGLVVVFVAGSRRRRRARVAPPETVEEVEEVEELEALEELEGAEPELEEAPPEARVEEGEEEVLVAEEVEIADEATAEEEAAEESEAEAAARRAAVERAAAEEAARQAAVEQAAAEEAAARHAAVEEAAAEQAAAEQAAAEQAAAEQAAAEQAAAEQAAAEQAAAEQAAAEEAARRAAAEQAEPAPSPPPEPEPEPAPPPPPPPPRPRPRPQAPPPPEPAPTEPATPAPVGTGASEWEAWQAELRSIAGDLDEQPETGDDTAT